MTRLKTATTGAALAIAIVAAVPGATSAATPNAAARAITNVAKQLQRQVSGRAFAFGTLTGIGTNSVTINTPNNGSLTINVVPKVRLVAHTQAAATAGYKTGDQVLINGTYLNGFTGSAIVYDTVAFPIPVAVRVAGNVSTSSTQSLTVALANNTSQQVQLGAQTRYFNNGAVSGTAPTFTGNEKVTVLAQEQTDGSLVARIVAIGTLQTTTKTKATGLVLVAGTVGTVASDNQSFTLALRNGKTANVTISGATKFRVNGKAATTAPTLTPNERVVVQGTRSTDASGNITIAATLIVVRTSA